MSHPHRRVLIGLCACAALLWTVLAPIDRVRADTLALYGTVRDFQDTHPDFEKYLGVDPGIVLPQLGPDGKPVYAGRAGNPTTTSQAAFDQWYRDVPGVNLSRTLAIQLDNTQDPNRSIFTYANDAFFPIDDALFGNQGRRHNFHFTLELHSRFTYQRGQFFQFAGDDDLWVFIRQRLVIDLGGVHGTMTDSVNLNTLGLTPGDTYDFDLFFAERHTSESHFRIDTSIALVPPTVTPTDTPTDTATATATATATPTFTPTPTAMPTPSFTPSPTTPPTAAPSFTPTASPTPTATRSPRPTPTVTHTPAPPRRRYLPLLLRERCPANLRRPIALALVIDASSSMTELTRAGRTKLQAALEAVLVPIGLLQPGSGDQMAMVVFNSNAVLLTPLTSDPVVLRAALLRVRVARGTRLDAGVRLGAQSLASARPGVDRRMVVLTDGLPSPTTPADARSAAAAARAAGIVIDTIGLGSDADPVLLADMAGDPRRFHLAPDGEDLARLFADLVWLPPACKGLWPQGGSWP